MKNAVCTYVGVAGSMIVQWLGGWNSLIATLLIFMAVDYVTGLIVAGVFKSSTKTKNGALESNAGFKGLFKKVMILAFVLIGARLDLTLGTDYIKTGVCVAFMVNELISIVENAGLMGVGVPKIVLNAIDVLKNREK